MAPLHFSCMTNGCDGWAATWITLDGRNKHTCLACRDELMARFGWKLLDWEDAVLHRTS